MILQVLYFFGIVLDGSAVLSENNSAEVRSGFVHRLLRPRPSAGRIPGTVKTATVCLIPKNAKKPTGKRDLFG